MNRQVAVVGLAAAGFVAVAAVIVLRMDAPEPEEPAEVVAVPEAPASAPVAATASDTPLKIGIPSIVKPPRPCATPPTTIVPYTNTSATDPRLPSAG